MKFGMSPFAAALLPTLSAGIGLGHPHPFSRTLQRHLQVDFGFNGTTPEEVCDSIIENWYFDGFPEKFFTSCTCEPKSSGGYSVSCIDYCEYCLPGACSRFSSAFELNEELLVEKLEGCDDFNVTSFDGITICYREVYTTNASTVDYFVDDQKCASAENVDCPLLLAPLPLVDCSNLGYGMDMNFCAEGTITTGPFSFLSALWFSPDNFTVGQCSPPQCQSVLDASDVCIETKLSESQGAECRSCVLQAFESIEGTNPSSCTEGEDIICALINQCDNECRSCEDKVMDFVECYVPNVLVVLLIVQPLEPCPPLYQPQEPCQQLIQRREQFQPLLQPWEQSWPLLPPL